MGIFYQRFVEACARKGVPPSAAAMAIGLSNSVTTYWKKSDGVPKIETLKKLGDFLGVSPDYLSGFSDIMAPVTPVVENTDDHLTNTLSAEFASVVYQALKRADKLTNDIGSDPNAIIAPSSIPVVILVEKNIKYLEESLDTLLHGLEYQLNILKQQKKDEPGQE